MKSQHFDAIIFGNGLTARIAAFLAGRRGRRILMVSDEHPGKVSHALPCCRQLDKLLTILGADRSHLHAAGDVQLIGAQHRLNLTSRPLDAEWRRELTNRAEAPARLLQTLGEWGEKLAQALAAQSPSAFFSLHSQIRLAATAWKPSRDRIPLSTPLSRQLKRHSDSEAFGLLHDLFCSLSGLPVDFLNTAQAALLWHWTCLPTVFNGDAFSEILARRTQQFHVTEKPGAQLESLEWSGRHLEGICLKDGLSIRAAQFVFVGQEIMPLPPAASKNRQPMNCASRPTWRTTPIRGTISPLLANRFILSGTIPLLVTRDDSSEGVRFLIEGSAHTGEHSYPGLEVARRLRTLLPFTDFQLEEISLPERNHPYKRYVQLCGLPCSPSRKNLLTAIPEWLCPGLGVNGEILLGFALAEQLSTTTR